MDSNVLMGILFSLTMGLAFLGLGLFGVYGISDNEVRNLLWGSLSFCRWRDFWIMAAAAGAGNRRRGGVLQGDAGDPLLPRPRGRGRRARHARLDALPGPDQRGADGQLSDRRRADDLQPADQPGRGRLPAGQGLRPDAGAVGRVRALSGLGGFLLAAATDLPTGAMIVILSSLLVGLAWAISALRRRAGR